jgi:N-methylhydantoinase A/oxoprolinase/acetone carboxylase beta subunit
MRVAFDIGGTFTDVLVLDDDGRLFSSKVLSLLDGLGGMIARSLDAISDAARVEQFVHATTICSNSLIERSYGPTALLTTRGFRDALEMRSQKGPRVFTVDWRPPPSLVPRDLCMEIDERIAADGSVHAELDEESVERAAERLGDLGVDAVAVCLVNSFVNPTHEQRIERILRDRLPGVGVCVSSAVHPEIREYERTSTTVVNACLSPVVTEYLDALERAFIRFGGDLHVMQSNGGIMSSAAARRRPIAMIESGPAAGALAAGKLARELGLDRVLSFDMGGTTAKACLICDGVPLERAALEVGSASTGAKPEHSDGFAVRIPTIDLVEVGAGGGSIAWVDDGVLRVGPASAGADPGPVCYGRGGRQPTVTDANVVLGYLSSDSIADGSIAVDGDAAFAAVGVLGRDLGLEVVEAAHGIVHVANVVMMRALRAVSIERGYDPRAFALVAFGGAGPVHATALAAMVGIDTVIVPPLPGVFSAVGLMLAEHRLDLVRSVTTPLASLDGARIVAEFAELEHRAAREMEQLGMVVGDLDHIRSVDMKYGHQVEDLAVPFPPEVHTSELAEALAKMFAETHRREFGHVGNGDVTVVNLRLQAIAHSGDLSVRDAGRRSVGSATAPPADVEGSRSRGVYFRTHGFIDTPVVRRTTMGEETTGPVIVEEPDTSVIVPPDWVVRVDAGAILTLTHRRQ